MLLDVPAPQLPQQKPTRPPGAVWAGDILISALFMNAGFRDLALVDIRSASSRFLLMPIHVDLPECSRLTARRRSKGLIPGQRDRAAQRLSGGNRRASHFRDKAYRLSSLETEKR